MGKYLRSCSSNQTPPSPAAVAERAAAPAAYSYLTLRSGRRVPAAAAGGGPSWRRHRRGGCGARKCGTTTSSASPSRLRRRCKAGDSEGGGRAAELSPQGNSVGGGDSCGESWDKCVSGEVVTAGHDGGEYNHRRVVGRPSLSPPPTEAAEIEAFFAAAELAERRRFAETYNYDVALDRPLQGRFEWAPVWT